MRREDELAGLSAHMSAATARWLELVWEYFEDVDSDDPVGFLAYRCGVTRREASEYLRVAEALRELPVMRAAFSRGELTFTKVRVADAGGDGLLRGPADRARGSAHGLAARACAPRLPADHGRRCA